MSSLTAAVLGAGMTIAPMASAWAPTASADQQLRGGQPYSEVAAAPDGAVLIHAAIDIQAPPKVVWSVMNDCNKANRLVVTVISCKILQSDPAHGTEVRETVTSGNLVVPVIHNVVRETLQPYSLIKFSKAGGNLKQEEGEWRLIPMDGGTGTRVIYENLVGADVMAPASLVRIAMRKDTAKVMVNIRRESLAAK